jgi:urease accessory protein
MTTISRTRKPLRAGHPWLRRLLAALALLSLAAPALAHDGHGPHGFAAGLVHPATGIDHLLAIIAVGWWSAATQGPRWWLVPSAFAASMLAGALLGLAGLSPPATEFLIALSVIASGALLLGRARVATSTALALAAGFALLHGLAHGSEAPRGDAPGWLAGMVVATLALHLVGATAAPLARHRARWLAPLAGATTVATGVILAASLIAG